MRSVIVPRFCLAARVLGCSFGSVVEGPESPALRDYACNILSLC